MVRQTVSVRRGCDKTPLERPLLRAARCEALFVSRLQPSDHPSSATVKLTISMMVSQFGTRGCACLVAQEFGDHPDVAVARMSWCRAEVSR